MSTASPVVALTLKPAQHLCRRHEACLNREQIFHFRHGFSRPSDDRVGVALVAGRVLPVFHLVGDMGDAIEHADRHGRVDRALRLIWLKAVSSIPANVEPGATSRSRP